MRRTIGTIAGLSALCVALASPAVRAQEGPAKAGLHLELNRLEQNGGACRATFVAKNGYGAQLEETAFELVLFDKAGLVSLMTVFDFGALPTGKTLVKRFDLKDTDCSTLSRVLVNAAARCRGAGIGPADCIADLTTANRSEAEFGR